MAPSFEGERDRLLEAFADTLARTAVFAAGDGGALLGMAGFVRLEGKENHKGLLWGMYVRETARGSGAADALVAAVIGHAREQVEVLLLAVGVHNEAAHRLYSRHGFVEYGREPRALKAGDVYYDEILMRLELRRYRRQVYLPLVCRAERGIVRASSDEVHLRRVCLTGIPAAPEIAKA